jgi:hypothetical protein
MTKAQMVSSNEWVMAVKPCLTQGELKMNRRTLFLASLFIIFLFLMTACTQEPVSMTLSDMQAIAADACIGVEIPVISQRLDGPIEDVAGVETHWAIPSVPDYPI